MTTNYESMLNPNLLNGSVKIGWAKTDITPQGKTLLQGQFYTRITDKVGSRLTATALALEVCQDDGRRDHLVMLSCDLALINFKSEFAKTLAKINQDIDPGKVIINATHTHSAPPTRSGSYDEPADDPLFIKPAAYLVYLVEKLAHVVNDAWCARRAGGLARGFSHAVTGRSRRSTYSDGSTKMYGATNTPTFYGFEAGDNSNVHLLFTYDVDEKLTGIVINVACPSQVLEHSDYFSADFWDVVRQGVSTRYGAAVHLLPQCAPAGDLTPRFLADGKIEADLEARLGLDLCGMIARRIMAAVADGLATAAPIARQLAFAVLPLRWELPRMRVTAEEYKLERQIPFLSKEELAKQHYAFQRLWPFGKASELISRYENQDSQPLHEVFCHFVRLGDIVIATNPFELYHDYGVRLSCRSPAVQNFMVQLCERPDAGDGYYLPTRRAMVGGHYSAQIKSCWVGPEGGDLLVENSVAAINALFAQ